MLILCWEFLHLYSWLLYNSCTVDSCTGVGVLPCCAVKNPRITLYLALCICNPMYYCVSPGCCWVYSWLCVVSSLLLWSRPVLGIRTVTRLVVRAPSVDLMVRVRSIGGTVLGSCTCAAKGGWASCQHSSQALVGDREGPQCLTFILA